MEESLQVSPILMKSIKQDYFQRRENNLFYFMGVHKIWVRDIFSLSSIQEKKNCKHHLVWLFWSAYLLRIEFRCLQSCARNFVPRMVVLEEGVTYKASREKEALGSTEVKLLDEKTNFPGSLS